MAKIILEIKAPIVYTCSGHLRALVEHSLTCGLDNLQALKVTKGAYFFAGYLRAFG